MLNVLEKIPSASILELDKLLPENFKNRIWGIYGLIMKTASAKFTNKTSLLIQGVKEKFDELGN